MNGKNLHVKRLFLFFLFFASAFFPQINPQLIFPAREIALELDSVNADSIRKITFTFVGDLMCHSTQFNYARTDSDKFDFKPVFEPVKNFLTESDFTLGNFETVTAGKELGFSGYPLFNTPDEFVEALAFAGFDVLFTANNHALDQSETGVKRTIETINKYGLKNVGTCKKNENKFLLLEKNGVKFALLAYTYGTNGFSLPDSSEYCVNVISRKNLRKDLTLARSVNPDFIIVYFHFGTEYSREPDDFQRDYVNYALRYGADIVIGSHPHVVQPIEKITGNRIRKSFVAYSLGNFISNQRWRYSDCGIILKFGIEKNIFRKTVKLSGPYYLPIWVYKGAVDENGRQGYRIYALTDTLNTKPNPFFTDEDMRVMNESFRDTKEIIGNTAKLYLQTTK